jgi:hypothetical protein
MNVFVTGGSGFIGKTLCRHLLGQGHGVTVLSRGAGGGGGLPTGVAMCQGDPNLPGAWQDVAAGHDAFVNLVGASVFERWTSEHKETIRLSRVAGTRNLVAAMALRRGARPAVLVSASAVGYYGFCGDEELGEDAPGGDGFLARVCADWEAEAVRAEGLGARVVRARFGIVMGREGGALGQMLPLFTRGLGGTLGGGRQWFSWIHQLDLVAAIAFCLGRDEIRGAVNCCAPSPLTNRDFTKALARAVGKPAFLPVPGFALRLALGEFGSVLLQGQRVVPRVLSRAGFQFLFPTMDQALEDLLGRG